MYPFSPNPLPSRLSHNIEQNFLWYTVGPCCLSILYIAVCIWPFPKFYLSLPPSNISLFSRSLSIIRLWLRLWTPYCQIQIYWRKVGKTTRTLRYDLNQIPYDYTVEVRNRFKGLDLIDRVPDELWTEVHDIVQETGIKTIPKKKEMQKRKMAVWRGLTNSCEKKRSEKQRRKGKIYPFECRVPKNSKKR